MGMIIIGENLKKKDKIAHKIGVYHNKKSWTKCGKELNVDSMKRRFGNEEELLKKNKKCKRCFA